MRDAQLRETRKRARQVASDEHMSTHIWASVATERSGSRYFSFFSLSAASDIISACRKPTRTFLVLSSDTCCTLTLSSSAKVWLSHCVEFCVMSLCKLRFYDLSNCTTPTYHNKNIFYKWLKRKTNILESKQTNTGKGNSWKSHGMRSYEPDALRVLVILAGWGNYSFRPLHSSMETLQIAIVLCQYFWKFHFHLAKNCNGNEASVCSAPCPVDPPPPSIPPSSSIASSNQDIMRAKQGCIPTLRAAGFCERGLEPPIGGRATQAQGVRWKSTSPFPPPKNTHKKKKKKNYLTGLRSLGCLSSRTLRRPCWCLADTQRSPSPAPHITSGNERPCPHLPILLLPVI